jgi:hypothetical protein
MPRLPDKEEIPSPLAGLMKFNGAMEEAAARSRAAMETALKSLQEESVEFMNRRIERNAHAMEEGRNCRSMMDLVAMQQKWAAEFAKDCFDESLRLSGVMQKWMQEANAFSMHEGLSAHTTELHPAAKPASTEHRAAAE